MALLPAAHVRKLAVQPAAVAAPRTALRSGRRVLAPSHAEVESSGEWISRNRGRAPNVSAPFRGCPLIPPGDHKLTGRSMRAERASVAPQEPKERRAERHLLPLAASPTASRVRRPRPNGQTAARRGRRVRRAGRETEVAIPAPHLGPTLFRLRRGSFRCRTHRYHRLPNRHRSAIEHCATPARLDLQTVGCSPRTGRLRGHTSGTGAGMDSDREHAQAVRFPIPRLCRTAHRRAACYDPALHRRTG